MAFYMIPYNHDDKLNIYVCLKIILTIITQHFYTFITQNFDFYNLKFRSFILKYILRKIENFKLWLWITKSLFLVIRWNVKLLLYF